MTGRWDCEILLNINLLSVPLHVKKHLCIVESWLINIHWQLAFNSVLGSSQPWLIESTDAIDVPAREAREARHQVTHIEFQRDGSRRVGRQTQTWLRSLVGRTLESAVSGVDRV